MGFENGGGRAGITGRHLLNWGCIPTKALLKSAQVFEYITHAKDYGITVADANADFEGMIKRSRGVADGMNKGVAFLMKKNKIDVLTGNAKLTRGKKVEVTAADGSRKRIRSKKYNYCNGGRAKELPNLKIDGKKIIEYRKAMSLEKQPKSMVVVGAGAIGVEFAYFYHSIGTEVTILISGTGFGPREDEEISKELTKVYTKSGIKVLANTSVESVDTKGAQCKVLTKSKGRQNSRNCVRRGIVCGGRDSKYEKHRIGRIRHPNGSGLD